MAAPMRARHEILAKTDIIRSDGAREYRSARDERAFELNRMAKPRQVSQFLNRVPNTSDRQKFSLRKLAVINLAKVTPKRVFDALEDAEDIAAS
jgi:hypothetical protein